MKITVIGLGYIGLPTALLLAKEGHKVQGYDKDLNKINKLKEGLLPFEEKGLKKLFEEAGNNFEPIEKLGKSEAYLICVPTPEKEREIDLKPLNKAIEEIKRVIEKENLVIIESTISPGISEKISKDLNTKLIAYCPERAMPGKTLEEMQFNDRVIGGTSKEAVQKAKEVYSFVKGNIFITNSKTAEVVKLIENTYRDVNIALANELAKISMEINIDVWETIKLANKHPRVNILKPGPGVGGHCIPIDPYFLANSTDKNRIISVSREINDSMPNYVIKLLEKKVGNVYGKTICLLGYSYKPNVDDIRKTPAEKIEKGLKMKGAKVIIHDPHVKSIKNNVSFEEAIEKADYFILTTAHDKFKEYDWKNFKKPLVDTHNFLTEVKNRIILGNGK